MILNTTIEVETRGHCDVHDVTNAVQRKVRESGLVRGTALVFVSGSTAGVTTVEFEPGLVQDIEEFFQRLVPEGPEYHHHATWGDRRSDSRRVDPTTNPVSTARLHAPSGLARIPPPRHLQSS
jgi:thiamine phosphate synthase YjbQ (UPF0047 family)